MPSSTSDEVRNGIRSLANRMDNTNTQKKMQKHNAQNIVTFLSWQDIALHNLQKLYKPTNISKYNKQGLCLHKTYVKIY